MRCLSSAQKERKKLTKTSIFSHTILVQSFKVAGKGRMNIQFYKMKNSFFKKETREGNEKMLKTISKYEVNKKRDMSCICKTMTMTMQDNQRCNTSLQQE